MHLKTNLQLRKEKKEYVDCRQFEFQISFLFLQCIVDRNRKYGADVILTCGFIYVSGFCFSFQNDSTVLGNCTVWRIYISPQTVGNIVKIKQGSAGGWLRKIIEQHPKLCTASMYYEKYAFALTHEIGSVCFIIF